eukprot:39383_1
MDLLSRELELYPMNNAMISSHRCPTSSSNGLTTHVSSVTASAHSAGDHEQDIRESSTRSCIWISQAQNNRTRNKNHPIQSCIKNARLDEYKTAEESIVCNIITLTPPIPNITSISGHLDKVAGDDAFNWNFNRKTKHFVVFIREIKTLFYNGQYMKVKDISYAKPGVRSEIKEWFMCVGRTQSTGETVAAMFVGKEVHKFINLIKDACHGIDAVYDNTCNLNVSVHASVECVCACIVNNGAIQSEINNGYAKHSLSIYENTFDLEQYCFDADSERKTPLIDMNVNAKHVVCVFGFVFTTKSCGILDVIEATEEEEEEWTMTVKEELFIWMSLEQQKKKKNGQ